jgi:hypothetical protein
MFRGLTRRLSLPLHGPPSPVISFARLQVRADGLAILEVNSSTEMAQRAPRLSPPAGLVGLLPTATQASHDPGDLFVDVTVSVRLARSEMGADSLPVGEEPSAEMADSLGLRRRHRLTPCHGSATWIGRYRRLIWKQWEAVDGDAPWERESMNRRIWRGHARIIRLFGRSHMVSTPTCTVRSGADQLAAGPRSPAHRAPGEHR